MRRISSFFLLLTLAACTPAHGPVGENAVTYGESGTAASSSVEVGETAAAKLKNLPSLFRENQHHYVIILATGKDKAAANVLARDNGGWVLPTDLTSNLTPGLYAVVHGPFADEKEAKTMLGQSFPETQNAYVKDAGALEIPPGLERYAATIPARVLVAVAGRTDVPLSGLTIETQWEETGGTLCNPISSSYYFSMMSDGKPLMDSSTPKEIELIKQFTKEQNPEPHRYRMGFDLAEHTGEVRGPQFCWD